MHVHILGICGTFMGGLALLARALGHRVSGSDANVYPPMSTQLERSGIELMEGYLPQHLDPAPDVVVIGNALSRGNLAVEYVLDRGLAYVSGPEWLSQQVLQGRWVLAVAGTHGKTTTASMLAWILDYAGLNPGFLIGGVAADFGISARLGDRPFFVIEADEYDTAFFDKRSKFVHYRPRTLILNNLEFDHADIFEDLGMIQRQFHHLIRTVPATGQIILPLDDPNLTQVIAEGCWTPQVTFGGEGADWQVAEAAADGSSFTPVHRDWRGHLSWQQSGEHNIHNALAAMAAAQHAGVPAPVAVEALAQFGGVKRRMELLGEVCGVKVYDDFAHHPTAIETTLNGLRNRVTTGRIFALLEPRSNTMRMGVHEERLAASLQAADRVLVYRPPDLEWNLDQSLAPLGKRLQIARTVAKIVASTVAEAVPGDHVLVMSNGGFDNIHQRLLSALRAKEEQDE